MLVRTNEKDIELVLDYIASFISRIRLVKLLRKYRNDTKSEEKTFDKKVD